MQSVIAIFLISLGLTFVGPRAYADEGWYADFHMRVGAAHNRLTIGQNEQASEGHDNLWETPVPEQFLIGAVSSYFYYPEWKQDSAYFWRDIQPTGELPCEWEFVVKTKAPNIEVKIDWDLSRLSPSIKLYLKEKDSDRQIDLSREQEYLYKTASKENIFVITAIAR